MIQWAMLQSLSFLTSFVSSLLILNPPPLSLSLSFFLSLSVSLYFCPSLYLSSCDTRRFFSYRNRNWRIIHFFVSSADGVDFKCVR
uniref:Secreted protein n=1 Tax=Anopheles darlingi TaxID=43151 RepID=A0A2M4D4G2_ANODA